MLAKVDGDTNPHTFLAHTISSDDMMHVFLYTMVVALHWLGHCGIVSGTKPFVWRPSTEEQPSSRNSAARTAPQLGDTMQEDSSFWD